MNRYKIAGLSLALLILSLFYVISCKKSNNNEELSSRNGTTESNNVQALLVDCDCCGADSLVRISPDSVSPANVSNYTAWTSDIVELCSNGLKVALEGQFHSFFRVNVGGQTGWSIGTIANTASPTLSWAGIIGHGTFSERCDNFGTTGSVFQPAPPLQGVIGVDGFNFGSNFGLGYYNYPSQGSPPNVIRDIILWKNCTTPGTCSDPAAATIGYRIKVHYVNFFLVAGGTMYKSEVKFSWTCFTI